MFLSRRQRPPKTPAAALTGPVTLPGHRLGAWLEGERRDVAVYAPGGYCWAPQAGEEVLVLKAGESGEQPCAVGVPAAAEGLAPGQVLIHAGGCSIRLDPGGSVSVIGNLTVNGRNVVLEPPKEEG